MLDTLIVSILLLVLLIFIWIMFFITEYCQGLSSISDHEKQDKIVDFYNFYHAFKKGENRDGYFYHIAMLFIYESICYYYFVDGEWQEITVGNLFLFPWTVITFKNRENGDTCRFWTKKGLIVRIKELKHIWDIDQIKDKII